MAATTFSASATTSGPMPSPPITRSSHSRCLRCRKRGLRNKKPPTRRRTVDSARREPACASDDDYRDDWTRAGRSSRASVHLGRRRRQLDLAAWQHRRPCPPTRSRRTTPARGRRHCRPRRRGAPSPAAGAAPGSWSTPHLAGRRARLPVARTAWTVAGTGGQHPLAVMGGFAGAVVAGLAWWAIVATTRIQVTFVALGVGWAVAQAVLVCCTGASGCRSRPSPVRSPWRRWRSASTSSSARCSSRTSRS